MRKRKFKRRRYSKYRNRVRPGETMEEYADRNELLLSLGFKDYRTYLRSALWKDIRIRKLELDSECFACGRGAESTIVQVHHGKYTRENLLGNTLNDLYTVCSGCHKKIEVTRSGFKRTPTEATRELHRLKRCNIRKPTVRTVTGIYILAHNGIRRYRV